MKLSALISRLSFQTKVLLPVLTLLVALPAITVTLVDRHVERRALVEAEQRLDTAEAVLRNSMEIRDRSQRVQFKNVANEPRFKAVSQLDDPSTMLAFLRELLNEFEPDVELLLYTPINGSASSAARRANNFEVPTFESLVASSVETALGGELDTELLVYEQNPYNVISVPVLPTSSPYPSGSLTIAVNLGEKAIKDLTSLTNTELLLASHSEIVGSSLQPAQTAQAFSLLQYSASAPAPNSELRPIILAGEHFHMVTRHLANSEGQTTNLRYALLASYESELEALAQTRFLLIAISAVGIAFSVVTIWILIRRIAKPIRLLRDGAEAVGRGDLDHQVGYQSLDECGLLATAFNNMTGNLKSSRRQLETTVSELQETQTQLLQRETRLRESEEGLRLIIEGARDHVIFTIDDQGKPLRWNRAAERLLGYSSFEAKALPYETFFDPSDQATDAPAELLATATRHGQATFEGWRIRKDGTRFWADITISRLEKVEGSSGGGFVEIARDITARKEAETTLLRARDAAESSDRAKSEFLANMSHEFRTPMNGIIGMASLLGNLDLDSEQREYIDTIRVSADSLLAIIDDILDIAKIEAGQLQIDRSPFNLVEAVEEVAQLLQPDCDAKNLGLHLVLGYQLPACVDTDVVRLRQVLVNIVGNAIKFTQAGGVTVSVDYDSQSEQLRFAIKDTGIGIADDVREQLFKPFFQVQSSASREYGGTGLGLSIARNIVKLMGGDIYIESILGQGSTFSFHVHAPIYPINSALERFEQRRFLVLSDDPICGAALKLQLANWGAQTDCLPSTPEAANKAMREGSYDLLLVDNSAARLDTIRAIIESRQELEQRFPPFIRLVAGEATDEPPPTARSAVLAKPLRPSALNRQIRALLPAAPIAPLPPPAPPPVALSPQPATPLPAPAPATEALLAETCPLRLLVVEDNPINTKVLVGILRKLGYQPDTAENGEIGYKAAESVQYDAVLMDLQMPVMDGLESARRILASTLIEHPIFITAFTANARQEDREACEDAGMHDFVAKPARVPAIAAVLQRAHAWLQRQPAKNA